MTTASLILVAITVWGLMSFIMVVFASMLSSRISRQEEMRSMFEEWGHQGIGLAPTNITAKHEMAKTR